MTLREKYEEWGIILGATEGVGKAWGNDQRKRCYIYEMLLSLYENLCCTGSRCCHQRIFYDWNFQFTMEWPIWCRKGIHFKKWQRLLPVKRKRPNVDVEVITLGTTLTPSLLSNLPGGPQGEAVYERLLKTPEEVVDEAFWKIRKRTVCYFRRATIKPASMTGKRIIQKMTISAIWDLSIKNNYWSN